MIRRFVLVALLLIAGGVNAASVMRGPVVAGGAVAFPSTSLIDNFTGASAGTELTAVTPSGGGTWTNLNGGSTFFLTNSTANGILLNTLGQVPWYGHSGTYGPRSEAWISISVVGTTSQSKSISVLARGTTNAVGTVDGYRCSWDINSSNVTSMFIYQIDNGAVSGGSAKATASSPPAWGTGQFGIRVDGDVVTCYVDGTSYVTWTDPSSTYPSAGFIQIRGFQGAGATKSEWTNFGGGTMP